MTPWAMGEPQMKAAFFDLSALEPYRNDPRFDFHHNEIGGSINFSEEYVDSAPKRDNIFLRTFGFAYNKQLIRAVAVYLWYVSELTPEHQQLWNARLLTGDFQLHPDYIRTSIHPAFPGF